MTIEQHAVLSSPQRRCQTLLMLYLPGHSITVEHLSRVNNVDMTTVQQDVAEVSEEIQRYHQLTIVIQADGCYRIEGTTLDQRLCLFHWLRRALRLCPHFVTHCVIPTLKTQLKQLQIARTLYDETNLQALVNRCAHSLQRNFDARDGQFLRIYLQFCLLQHHVGLHPRFTPQQSAWAHATLEYQIATDIVHHWQRRVTQTPDQHEQYFLALLFMLLKVPDPHHDQHENDLQLHREIAHLIDRFQLIAGHRFHDVSDLHDRLYIHLDQALHRCVFGIGIDNHLPGEIHQLYPRLIRTTCAALIEFEQHYNVSFGEEETTLVAIIFGTGLMQEGELHEKQVVLLTGDNPALEYTLEQQLRELTLLPLHIKHLAVRTFQQEGAPKNSALVVSPYAITLPLFSPPLIHAEQPLNEHQQQHISQILES